MSVNEAGRLAVVRQVLDGQLKQASAGPQAWHLGSPSQTAVKLVRQQGVVGLIFKRRGRPSNRKNDDGVRQTLLELVRQRYSDFSPELAREHLAAHHGFARPGSKVQDSKSTNSPMKSRT